MKRIKGLKSLVQAAVEHGSRAVEKVQIEMARTPFDLLEQVDPIKVPVAGVRMLYNTGVSTTHGMIRLVNKVVGETLDVVIDTVDESVKAREKVAAKANEGGDKASSRAADEGDKASSRAADEGDKASSKAEEAAPSANDERPAA